MTEIQSELNYLCRAKYFNKVLELARAEQTKTRGQSAYSFYIGVCFMQTHRFKEALNVFDELKDDERLYLSSLVALIAIHKKFPNIDKETIAFLNSTLKEKRKKASAEALYYAGLFQYFNEKYDKAKEYVDKSLKLDENSIASLILSGYIEMNTSVDSATAVFRQVLTIDKQHLDASIGLNECYRLTEQFDECSSILNRLIVKYNHLPMVYVEKVKVQMAQRLFDEALETINRVLTIDKLNIEAKIIKLVIYLIAEPNNFNSDQLNDVYEMINDYESNNSRLFMRVFTIFSRISEKNATVLDVCVKCVEKYAEIVGDSNELGYLRILQGRFKDARDYFRNVLETNDNFEAIVYLNYAKIKLKDENIDNLHLINSNDPFLKLTLALIEKDSSKQYDLLKSAYDHQLNAIESTTFGIDYIIKLNPEFCLEIVNEALARAKTPEFVNLSIAILTRLINDFPGLSKPQFFLAKIQAKEHAQASIRTLNALIERDSNVEYYLTLADIYLTCNHVNRADDTLELAVSRNFKITEHPAYHFIKGLIAKARGDAGSWLGNLKIALNLIENGHVSADKLPVCLELIDAYTTTGDQTEAEKLIQDLIVNSNDSRVTIANAEFQIKTNRINQALELLESIPVDDDNFLSANQKLAELHLTHFNDRSSYIRCFEKIAKQKPGSNTLIMLGDAYFTILDLDNAIKTYERACDLSPNDAELMAKMGRALVKTYRFDDAVEYYKKIVNSSTNREIKFDLIELYVKLDRFDDAERLLVDGLRKDGDDDDREMKVREFMLLADVLERLNSRGKALSVLKEAKDLQGVIVKRSIIDRSAVIDAHKKTFSQICVKLATICQSMHLNEEAVTHYREAQTATPHDFDILTALAKLYMQVNEFEQCERVCRDILATDAENESTLLIIADISFHKVEFDAAYVHFKQLIGKQPTYWSALVRLIEIARRVGQLEEIPKFLRLAEEKLLGGKDPGFTYCAALYEWYSYNWNGALRLFNRVRNDKNWGQSAISNMIDICLNPDDESVGSGYFDNDDGILNSRSMAIEMAERLHMEMNPHMDNASLDHRMSDESLNCRLLKNFILLGTNDRQNVERALQDFTTIASMADYKDYIGPIYGLASAYLLQKQTQRAKNYLKRVVKTSWTYEDAEYLERSWLMLADIYLQANKHDMTSELVRKVLYHNKSCVRAYEYEGFINEKKEQNYREAINSYKSAWKYCNHKKSSIGFKLAHAQLKAKQYADAIETCYQVLKLHPDHPRIKKDVFDKARANLRT